MRELLEFLGLVSRPAGRREPVALPAWFGWAVPAAIAVLTVASVVVSALMRLLLS